MPFFLLVGGDIDGRTGSYASLVGWGVGEAGSGGCKRHNDLVARQTRMMYDLAIFQIKFITASTCF